MQIVGHAASDIGMRITEYQVNAKLVASFFVKKKTSYLRKPG